MQSLKLKSYFDSETTPDDLLIKYTDEVNDAIYAALGNLSDNPEWDAVPCLLTDDGVFDIKRESYQEQFDICLEYCIKNENYAAAANLNSFKEKIDK